MAPPKTHTHTLICLEYMCSVSSRLRARVVLIVKTLTNVPVTITNARLFVFFQRALSLSREVRCDSIEKEKV